ncbi:hypothetical protein [Albibacterium bauzanense]|uniref:TRASH domain-containing protein n=1 Tax=Albibacterium bauzanense TaxID=653929 RepID=A0A4R1M1T1_9SPHI|nr:hypothetical protein [Albibacterium bauzanense]TCK85297.1 hypothetical protein C8N28_0602 [Albibacterium bauzanense]
MNIISKIKYIGIVVLASVLFNACNLGNNENEVVAQQATSAPQIGDRVPNNLVCMVNNAYMGVPQLEVSFEGKTYFGCCEMCQERIPKEKEVRTAIDLYSLKAVDKADAYIVLVGDHGEVAYFENEKNYKDLIAKSNLNKQ